MRLSLVIVNWEMFCWPADVCFAHAYLSHRHAGLPSWFALSCFATLLLAVCLVCTFYVNNVMIIVISCFSRNILICFRF